MKKMIYVTLFLLLLSSCNKEEAIILENTTLKALSGNSVGTLLTASAKFSPRAGHTTTVFKDTLWVIGGWINGKYNTNDVWNSTNGIDWKPVALQAIFPPRFGHTTTVFDNKLWAIGGRDNSKRFGDCEYNDVWYSEDGRQWHLVTASAPFTPRYAHSTVVFDDKLWVIGGNYADLSKSDRLIYNSDVWYSENGIDWIRAREKAAFGPRAKHETVIFDESFLLIAGEASRFERRNDIYKSADCGQWEFIADGSSTETLAHFSSRSTHTVNAFRNQLWLIGGYYQGENFQDIYFNDVWISNDGAIWEKQTEDTKFLPRSFHTATVFKDKLLLMGGVGKGINGDRVFYNDVWIIE